jgi:hypothetical protein
MTKKRREQLPGPGDSRWAPLDDLHAPLIPRTGNRELAALDLTKLLATPPPHGVRSMRRYFGLYRDRSRPELEWELLEFSFWEEHVLSGWSDGLCIRHIRSRQALRAVGFYGWKPDFEKIYPTEPAQPGERQLTPQVREGQPKTGSADVWIDFLFPDDEWRLLTATQIHDAIARHAKDKGWKTFPSYSAVAAALSKRLT